MEVFYQLWEIKEEMSSALLVCLHFDTPFMQAHDLTRKTEADARTFRFRREKRDENLVN